MRKLMIGLFAAVAAVVCSAADKYWTGAAGDGLLETPGNWTDNTKPASGDSFHFDTAPATPTRVYLPGHTGSYWTIPAITGTKDYTLVMPKAFVTKVGDTTGFAGNIEVACSASENYSIGGQFLPTADTVALNDVTLLYYWLFDFGSYTSSIKSLKGGFLRANGTSGSLSIGEVSGENAAVLLGGKKLSVGSVGVDGQSHVRLLDLRQADTKLTVADGRLEADVVRIPSTVSALTKSGAGTLSINAFRPGDAAVKVSVEGGTVEFHRPKQPSAEPAVAAGAYLHLDASVAESFTFDDNGGVTQWRDCRSGVSAKATTSMPYGAQATPPKRIEQGLNEMAIVDFGSFASGYNGGSLCFDQMASKRCREGFLVMRRKAAGSGAFFLGDAGTYDFHVATDGALLHQNSIANYVAAGAWTIDGETFVPHLDKMTEAFHVIRFALDEPARTCGLCYNRGHNSGGWEMAEVVLYETALTEQQRVDTEAFLLKKWLNARHPNVERKNGAANMEFAAGVDAVVSVDDDVELSSLAGGGRLVKEGAGTVTTKVGGGFTEMAVSGGKLDAEVSVEDGAFIHLDASVDSSIEKIDHPSDHVGRPGKYLKRWYDVRNNGRYAKLEQNREARPEQYPDIYPKVVEGGLNNLTYVDCGAPANGLDHPGLYFNETCPDAREIFLVWKDNSTEPSEMAKAFPVSSVNYCFHRGGSGQIGYNGLFYNNNTDTLWLDDGFCPVTTTVPSEGWHVMSLIVDPATKKRDCAADVTGLSYDRANRSGGISIAEALVFDQPLSEGQRAMLRAKLMKKWLKPETVVPAAEMVYDRVSVAAGATLKMNVSLTTSALDVGGTVETGMTLAEGGEIGVMVGRYGAFGSAVSGAVTLPAMGAVRLQLAEGVEKVKGGLYPILTSTTGEFSFDGDIKNWTIAGDYQSVVKGKVELVVKTDGLYLRLPSPGLMLLLR